MPKLRFTPTRLLAPGSSETQRLPGLQQGQGEVDDPLRGPKSSGIAIQRDDGFVGDAPNEAELILGDGGAEGGDGGGTIVCQGTPEKVAKVPESYTGQFLAPILARAGKK